jgi:preprotein translocase subunit SecA
MLINRVQKLLARNNLKKLDAVSVAAEGFKKTNEALSDDSLRAAFHAVGAVNGNNLPHALSLVREVARRTLGLFPYPVQLSGAAALFQGVIVEMKTGEGKTLTIALSAALAALERKGVHVATANPYLAERDALAMKPLYDFLGLSVGVTLPGQGIQEKKLAYASDITYGVHSEIGFDYLRDHLVANLDDRVQRELAFVIVDEADSILIDEARTPLIISQASSTVESQYALADRLARHLKAGRDFELEEKSRAATLTERGLDRVEAYLVQAGELPEGGSLYHAANLHLLRYIGSAIKAHNLFVRDRDYVVQDGEVKIVDDSTGRILEGRQWQDGLHQAVECKEGLIVKPESETAAEITYQSLFRLYDRLSGLTGTAMTSAEEFEDMYGLQVLSVPTHRPTIRDDLPDQLFRTQADKFNAIAADVKERVERGQPVLIGTASVNESEALSSRLNRAGIAHRVLNARQNADEATIIGDAGLPGSVTVATNMAGRGTDIVLGGHTEKDESWRVRHEQVLKAGGLHVIGTTRNESRRVDDQLRGRSGRQGDPGSSQFYLCLEDDLLRIFGGDRLARIFALTGVSDDAISGPLLDRAVANAQRKVEGRNFESRKNLAKYDGVMSEQRAAVYALRTEIMEGSADPEFAVGMVEDAGREIALRFVSDDSLPEQWNVKGLKDALETELGPNLPVIKWAVVEELDADTVVERVAEGVANYYREKREQEEHLSERERVILATVLDQAWKSHLTHLDGIREGIHLRAYAQMDPAVAFRREAFNAFLSFQKRFSANAASAITFAFRAQPEPAVPSAVIEVGTPVETAGHASGQSHPDEGAPFLSGRLSRNERCSCGSGLRYKHCHGKLS